MRNRRDIAFLKTVVDNIINNPSSDYDDTLFHVLLTLGELEKEAMLDGEITDNEKHYIKVSLDCGDTGEYRSFKSILLGFADCYSAYDGFALGPLLIEKDFIEEIVSAIGISSVSVTVDDISKFEGDVIVKAVEALESLPPGNTVIDIADDDCCSDYVIYAALPDTPDKMQLSSCYFNALRILRERNLHTIAFSSLKCRGFSEKESADIAESTIDTCLEMWQDYFFSVVFCVSDDSEFRTYTE